MTPDGAVRALPLCRVQGCRGAAHWPALRAGIERQVSLVSADALVATPELMLDAVADVVATAAVLLCHEHLEVFRRSPEWARCSAALGDFIARTVREGGTR